MKDSSYKDYAELPLFLNADTVAKTLGVSPASGYELLHEKIICGSSWAKNSDDCSSA